MGMLAGLDTIKALIIGVVIAGFYYMAFYDNGKAYESRIKERQQQVQVIQHKLQELNLKNQQVQVINQKLAVLDNKFKDYSKLMPVKITGVELVKVLSTEARSAGVSIVQISDSESANPSSTDENNKGRVIQGINVEIQLKGKFTQLLTFLSFLSQVKHVILLKSFSIQKEGSSDADPLAETIITMTGGFQAYRMVNNDGVLGGEQ